MEPQTVQERTCSRGHRCPVDHQYCGWCGEPVHDTASPVWATPADAVRVMSHRPHLKRTLLTAVIVGTVLFCINQLDVVLAGDATTGVWVKAGFTYLVPFAVSNVGILIATHQPGD